MLVIPILLSLLTVGYLAVCWYFSSTLLFPKTSDHETSLERELEKGRIQPNHYSQFIEMTKETVSIPSKHGYTLNGLWIPNGDSNRTIVFCHGITWNWVGAIKYTDLFWKLGFNLFLYDHRNHGKSGGRDTTYGYFEKDDLMACLDFVEKKKGIGTYIGTHGESLGAATVLQHLGIDSRVKFCIADCPYSDLNAILKYTLAREHHIRWLPVLPVATLFTKLRAGMHITDVSPISVIKTIQTPILWIHGESDLKVPVQMSIDMYEAKQNGIRALWVVPDARHASAIIVDQQGYEEKVKQFIAEVDHASS